MNTLRIRLLAIFFLAPTALFAADNVAPSPSQPVQSDIAVELQKQITREMSEPKNQSNALEALKGLDREKGKGFAVLDTESFFPEALVTKFHDAIYEHSRLENPNARLKELGLAGSVLVAPSPEQMAPMLEYVNWLSRMLNQTMRSDEQVDLASVELRLTSTQAQEWSFESWHVDDLYFTASVTLIGEGTEFFADGPKVSRDDFSSHKREFDARTDNQRVPRGRMLIFSSDDRGRAFANVRPIVHRAEATKSRCLRLTVRYVRKGAVSMKLPSVPLVLLPAQGGN